MVPAMASTDPKRRDEKAAGGDEEDIGVQIAPFVFLEDVAITTEEEEEEEEDILLDLKAKLLRFDKEGNQWVDRGTGNVKLLKHKKTGKVRLVMRRDRTLTICANHLVLPSIKMQEHVGNDKSCVWHAADFSDGELKEETFSIRFGSVENRKKFMEMFEDCKKEFMEMVEDCKTFMEMVEGIAESFGGNEERQNAGVSAAGRARGELECS